MVNVKRYFSIVDCYYFLSAGEEVLPNHWCWLMEYFALIKKPLNIFVDYFGIAPFWKLFI